MDSMGYSMDSASTKRYFSKVPGGKTSLSAVLLPPVLTLPSPPLLPDNSTPLWLHPVLSTHTLTMDSMSYPMGSAGTKRYISKVADVNTSPNEVLLSVEMIQAS